jgi:hypothetical protein
MATNHELFVEVAKLALACANTYVGYLAGYQYVFREDSRFRPYLGALFGYVHPSTSNACQSFAPATTYGAMLVGGLRFEPIPMIGIFAEGVGGVTAQPGGDGTTYGGIVAVGGGLQIALPF